MNKPTNTKIEPAENIMSDDFSEIERVLKLEKSVQIPQYIDRQIMAAAARELDIPVKPKNYQYSFLRKLSLPVYVATGFVFSVFAFNSLWQQPSYQTDFEQASPTQIIIDGNTIESPTNTKNSVLVKRELPLLVVAPESLDRSKKERDELLLDFDNNIENPPQDLSNQEIYTGIHLSKAEYPEKEAWARKIIGQMREGDMDLARTELVRFKKVYPNYPIEEQIKSFYY